MNVKDKRINFLSDKIARNTPFSIRVFHWRDCFDAALLFKRSFIFDHNIFSIGCAGLILQHIILISICAKLLFRAELASIAAASHCSRETAANESAVIRSKKIS